MHPIRSPCSNSYFRNIPKGDIYELIRSISVHRDSESYFDAKQITAFLERSDPELDMFDLLVIGGKDDSPNRFKYSDLNIDNALVYRSYDVPDDDKTVIRMSKQRARLGGRADAKNGLRKNEIPSGDDIRAQEYLIKGRNPLLIIYFVDPDNRDLSDEEVHSGASSIKEYVKVKLE